MSKIFKKERFYFSIKGGISFVDLSNRYAEIVADIHSKYEQVSDIKIECESGYYNEYENYYEDLIIAFNRLETDEEYEDRINRDRYIKEQSDERLKKMINDNKEFIISYLKDNKMI